MKKNEHKTIMDWMFDESQIKYEYCRSGRVRITIPARFTVKKRNQGRPFIELMNDHEWTKENIPQLVELPEMKDGNWEEAYHGTGFSEVYSTAWNGELKASCDLRIGDNFPGNILSQG